jgi:hypothetical protein
LVAPVGSGGGRVAVHPAGVVTVRRGGARGGVGRTGEPDQRRSAAPTRAASPAVRAAAATLVPRVLAMGCPFFSSRRKACWCVEKRLRGGPIRILNGNLSRS